jgi:hypothetical protein
MFPIVQNLFTADGCSEQKLHNPRLRQVAHRSAAPCGVPSRMFGPHVAPCRWTASSHASASLDS